MLKMQRFMVRVIEAERGMRGAERAALGAEVGAPRKADATINSKITANSRWQVWGRAFPLRFPGK